MNQDDKAPDHGAQQGFGTRAIHGGQQHDPSTGAVMPPVYLTSTYAQSAPGQHLGYEYSRTHNPTRTALQNSLASLEGGVEGLAFASGMAAIDAVLKLLLPGDEVVASNDLYGGTYRLFTKIFQHFGLVFRFVDMSQPLQVERAVNERTRLIWCETPTNPMLHIADIAALAEIKKRSGAMLVVDNTFASPYVQQPLALGADLVMHSATKYLGGHSDVVLGALVAKSEHLAERLRFVQNASGAVPGPLDCFLVLRGIKTLHLRMERHGTNGRVVAAFLKSHPKVKKVHWPGFPDHPGHEVASRQMRNFGGMLSFTLKDDALEKAFHLVSTLQVFTLAESLGGVESLCGHPASMTHASIPREERLKSGLEDSLIRLSVGIEDPEDLLADLQQALDKL
ncbi:cystathionine gamma-synthase [bacterium]|nr:cystathionine gamma-synthase [bacterium]